MRPTAMMPSNGAQMLLATGVVLLMSLLSMAIFGVKVAGLTLPHEAASDDVIDTTGQVLEVVQPLSQARMDFGWTAVWPRWKPLNLALTPSTMICCIMEKFAGWKSN